MLIGGRGVESLGVLTLDRLSSLTICRREIGKQKDAGRLIMNGETVAPVARLEVSHEGS
jgi:hypothetical protein